MKAHVSLEQAKSERSWKFLVWLATLILAASNFVGAMIVRWGRP